VSQPLQVLCMVWFICSQQLHRFSDWEPFSAPDALLPLALRLQSLHIHDKDSGPMSSLSVLKHTKKSTKLANDTSLFSSLPHGTHRRIVNLFRVNLVSSYEHLLISMVEIMEMRIRKTTLPPGMIHPLPPREETNKTSSSFLDRKQTQAARIRNPSWSLIASCFGFCLSGRPSRIETTCGRFSPEILLSCAGAQ